jgi:hypothetical protein
MVLFWKNLEWNLSGQEFPTGQLKYILLIQRERKWIENCEDWK